jgi:hypothetical protein
MCGCFSLFPCFLYHKPQQIDFLRFLLDGNHGVNPGRVHIGVPQNAGKTTQVTVLLIMLNGKQVTQIVREY